ncbi:MAG TPA: hypothetical protein VG938_17220 [Verrucomicrobiae bacterium]|jgi:hypothetical protein|nr:hypothetical protein [Verrucomicrobiae bacterium]
MNLRRRKPHDSLYMLLDTMCNAFGGIILLAVLVVLLTSRSKTQSATADSTRLLERRIALAQTNLQQSLQLAASLHAQAGDDRWKAQVSLLAERQQLEEELKAIRELAARSAEEIDANASSDPSERLKKLDAQLADGEVKKLEEQNKIDASKEEKKRVAAQLDVLEKKMEEVVKQSQQELRLPREHNTDRQAVYVIVLYGRIYFCHNADMTRNETDIKWTDRGGVEYADPRKGKGLDPIANAAQIRAYFTAQAHNSVYVVFLTLVDSFPAFIRAKELAVECGLPYGWLPWQVSLDGPLCFSTSGYSPSPQ